MNNEENVGTEKEARSTISMFLTPSKRETKQSVDGESSTWTTKDKLTLTGVTDPDFKLEISGTQDQIDAIMVDLKIKSPKHKPSLKLFPASQKTLDDHTE